MGLRLCICLKNKWSTGHFRGCCTPGFQQPRINDTRALNTHCPALTPQATECRQPFTALTLGLRSRLAGMRAVVSTHGGQLR